LGFLRLFGPGLGNLLFPWARFVVASRQYGLTPIAPAWPQFKWGTVKRGETDKRFYFGLFRAPAGQITGWRKALLLSRLRPVPEDAFRVAAEARRDEADCVVVFEGLGDYFEAVRDHHQYVRDQLLLMTRPEHKAGLTHDFRHSISVHVRLGDFGPPAGTAVLPPGSCTRLPLAWYRHVILQIRAAADADVPVHIFSDGTDEELAPLLQLPRVRRLTFGSSIADLLALSRACVLIASGSTFSRWASYLGRMPVVMYPGALGQHLYYENPAAEVECGTDECLPDDFLGQIDFLGRLPRLARGGDGCRA
jgi:hypothetical protein